MRFLKITAITLVLFVVITTIFIAYHFHSNVPVTSSEVFRDDEAEQAQRAADNFVNVIKETTTSYAARGAHAKGHACVRAFFEVSKSIDRNLRHGVFEKPGQVFKSWIRFSNGASNLAKSHDGENDSRGMALKLININQENETIDQDVSRTQDFLMHNSPVFFSGNIEDYNQLVESEDKIMSFLNGKNPFKWRLRELTHVFETLSPPPYSPLWDDYFSNTAYKLGPHNIKFSAQSCTASPNSSQQDKNDADFLRKTMIEELASEDACFKFKVQLQDMNKYMPIENPSIEWKQSDSPYITIATIRIPSQTFDENTQRQFCEDLSFSPWNALDVHRPIGELNRIRKKVYAASSSYRHSTNKTKVPQSLEW